MKRIDMPTLLLSFDESVRDRLSTIAARPGTTHLVVFENRQIDSSHRGARTAVTVGPSCTLQTLDAASAHWLNDLPSQRQYPVEYAEVTTGSA